MGVIGGFFAFLGSLIYLAGLISLIKPLTFLRIRTRGIAAIVMVAGLLLFSLGSAMQPKTNTEQAARQPAPVTNERRTAPPQATPQPTPATPAPTASRPAPAQRKTAPATPTTSTKAPSPPSAKTQPTPPKTTTSTKKSTPATHTPGTGECAYIGNRNSHIFHYPNCGRQPNPENRVCFRTRDDAIKAGYRPDKVCHP